VRGWRVLVATLVAVLIGVEAGGSENDARGGFSSLRGVRLLVAPVLPHAAHRVRGYAPVVAFGARHRGRVVALTFDDGPGPWTWRVVRELRRLRVPATFFEVGREVVRYPWAARQVARSFAVGDHTWDHVPMGRLSWAQQLDQTRTRASLFRPPYESYDRQTLGVMRLERKLVVLWDVDSRDWTRPGVRRIVSNVVPRVRPGSIVLLHDGGGVRWQTVAALPAIVRQLRARGYRFVTVPQMMRIAPRFRG
jgi:peptidoglycan/xylan/chitin deacetylase (PgdA/CDA1 family)